MTSPKPLEPQEASPDLHPPASRYSNANQSSRYYHHYEPAYQYGYHLASKPKFHSMSWQQAAPTIKELWQAQCDDCTWEQVETAARAGWHAARAQPRLEQSYHFASHRKAFYAHYRSYYARRGRPYSFYEAAYRYGYTLKQDEYLHKYQWHHIEARVRRDWELYHPTVSWADIRAAVYYGWTLIQ